MIVNRYICFIMELSNKGIKTYKASEKVILAPIIIGGIFTEIILLLMGEIEMTPVLIIILVMVGLVSLIVNGSLKVTIDADKQVLTLEKSNGFGKSVFKNVFLLNEIQFEILEQKAPRSGKIYLISIFNNDNKEEGNYAAAGFSRAMLELIKNNIKMIQTKNLVFAE